MRELDENEMSCI